MATPPPSRRSLAQRLAPVVLAVVGGAIGFGGSLGVRAFLPNSTDEAVESAEQTPSAEHTGEHAEPPTLPDAPLRQRIDLAVRSGEYGLGLRLVRLILDDHPTPTDTHESPEGGHDHAGPSGEGSSTAEPTLVYVKALCLEGLERWDEALDEYQLLGGESAPDSHRAIAACGEVRCHLAEDDLAAAEVALSRAVQFANGRSAVLTEIDYLRGRLAYRAMPAIRPGPFAPDHPVGGEPNTPPADYADWLSLPTSADGDRAHAAQPVPAASASDGAYELFLRVADADQPHPDVVTVWLTLANLLFARGEFDRAGELYQAVLDSQTPAAAAVVANYNLGLISHRRGEWALARKRLTDAADLAADTPTAALAWWWVGRVELDLGNVDACRTAWRRVWATADRELTAAAGLGEVFLRLLAGDSVRAAKIFHQQKMVNSDPIPQVRDAFACYFRYADSDTPFRREELATALQRADYGKPFGPAGRLLFGRWLVDIGRPEVMAKVYTAAFESPTGAWGVQFTLAVGEHLLAVGKWDEAEQKLTAVAVADGDEWGDRARFRLAELALRGGRAEECVRLARAVLAHDHVDRNDALRLLGRGYERLNQPRAAAECFAGRLPTK